MIGKKLVHAAAFSCCLLNLTGCWNRVEVNDLGISIAAAMDAEPHQKVRFSEQIALPNQMGGGKGAGGAKPYYTFSGVGEDLRDAMANLQTQMSRRLFLAHRRIFLISESIAHQDIRQYLDEVSRNPQGRLRTNVAVTHGAAYRYLQIKYPFERMPSEGLRKVLYGNSSNFKMDLKDVMIMLSTPGADAMIPIIDLQKSTPTTQSKFIADGIAVFHDGKMVGALTNDQASGVLWLRSEMKKTSLTTKLPKYNKTISCDLLRVTDDFHVSFSKGHPAIHVHIQPECDVSENNTGLGLNDPQNIKVVEQAFSQKVQHDITGALELLQHKYDADIVKFGDRVHHQDPQQWANLVNNWHQEFAKMPMTVDVQVKIRRVGMIGDSPTR